jgi:phenol hydroxylase P5 protein
MPGPASILKPRPFRVVANEPLAEGSYLLRLAPADGLEPFAFQAGQWAYLHIPDRDGKPWRRGAFSIASAPANSSEALEFAIKTYGEMTTRGRELRVGEEVGVQGPFGRFLVPAGDGPLLFIAGGIGIAPFRCMVRGILASGSPRPLVLVHSNRERNEIVFEGEFRDLAAKHPSFRYIPTLTGEAPAGWDGEQGRVDVAMLRRLLPGPIDADVLLCASNPFMDAMKPLLVELGVGPKRIHVERFY